jgi:hypothetical protein
LRAFENRVLERIFGHKKGWKEGCRRLHNEELHNLYASPNITRVIKSRRMSGLRCVAHMGDMRNAYNILAGKREGKRSLGRSRYRWEDNIRTDLKEKEWKGVDWMHLAQDRNQWRVLINTVMNFGFQKKWVFS